MSGSSWFALAGVVLSCVALAVSLIAYRLQAKTAKSDQQKELADQIDAIQQQMAKPGQGRRDLLTAQARRPPHAHDAQPGGRGVHELAARTQILAQRVRPGHTASVRAALARILVLSPPG